MDIVKEMEKNRVVLLLISGKDYSQCEISLAKKLAGKKTCYITLNKTYGALREIFEKNKINMGNIVFIDGISKTIKATPPNNGHCYFISSPAALTELSIIIGKLAKNDFKYFVFDSLTNLLIYEQKAPVARFISSVANQIRDGKASAVFYALSINEQETLIKECEMFMDKVLYFGGKGRGAKE